MTIFGLVGGEPRMFGGVAAPQGRWGDGGGASATAGKQTDDSAGWDEEELAEGEGGAKAQSSALQKLLHDQLTRIGERDVDINNVPTNSPLFSVKSFAELRLKEDLVKGVTAMGFHAPSKIQEVALPVLIGEPPTNMVAQSQSGTGKTAAFVLTMLNRVNPAQAWPQCLCLAPTYELAMQIGGVVERMGQFLADVTIAYAVRGNRPPRGAQLTQQIVIGTPGTALDWIRKQRLFDPTKLKVFVLDEADVMISEQGHKDQSIAVKRALDKSCQLLLFSATYDDDVMSFAEQIVDADPDNGEPPVIITVRREEQTLDTILQYVVEVASREEKFDAIHNLYGCLTIGQSIIFCHTKASAGWLATKMADAGHMVAKLSGDQPVEERAEVIRRFKAGQEKVLITTNVCSRGIDVRQVTLVINYDVPMLVQPHPTMPGRFRPTGPDYETYLHRIGRTGRFGKAGIAVNFVDSQLTKDCVHKIQDYFGKPIHHLDPTDLDALENIGTHK